MAHTQDITALALVLSAAVLAGIFMNRLRLPAAAGFILAGVAPWWVKYKPCEVLR